MRRGRGEHIANALMLLTELPQHREFGWQDVARAWDRTPDAHSRRHAYRWMDAFEAHGLVERVKRGVWRCRFRLVREERGVREETA